ncbi:tumor necrosis factor ligand superfamily member 15 [Paroedura picta]|uniref:tumor necrosis factor ligand superfamily member 15 n=1 Tax=Paroedura picta TaxID=143630 RepID=UPI004055EA14
MDRAADIPLQGSPPWPARHRCKRDSRGQLFGCLLAFCLLAVFMLALPVAYLLSKHLGEPPACKAEEKAFRMPEFQKQIGTPPATELKPWAHLTVSAPHELKCVPGFPSLLWKDDQTLQSSPKVKIHYENGFLVISKPGDYFVYAQVTFQNQITEKDNCSSGKVTRVTQTISTSSSRYPVPVELLRSSRTVGEIQNWKHAIYLGAIVHLQENDTLFVNVSSAKLVNNKHGETFFGAFLI